MTPPSPADLHAIEQTLRGARRRLVLRRLVSIGGLAAHLGSWVAVVVGLGVALLLGWLAGVLAALALWCVIVAIAATAAVLWPGLSRRELALLADRALGTDELLITALHLHEADDPRRDALLVQVAAAHQGRGDLLRALPVRTPRHLMAAPLAWALLAALLWFAPGRLGPLLGMGEASDDPVVQEGARLAERLDQLDDEAGITLPEDLEREVAALADDMSGNELSPEEALERLDDMQAQLEAFQDRLEPSDNLLEDLEQAAEALGAADATRELSEALDRGDLDGAADAARDLSEALSESTPAEQQRAADAMQKAGEQLQQSADPSVKQAGEALSRAGQQAKAGAQAGDASTQGTPQAGQPSSASGSQSPMTPQQAQDLAQQLQQARQAGERLQHDKQALERAQKLNGAMEASRQRLGGDAGVDQGSSSQGGEDGEGEGEGQGGGQQGEGEGGQGEGQSEGAGDGDGEGASGQQGMGVGGQAGTGAGAGHTWEDEGEFTGAPQPPPGPAAEDSERAAGEHIDDFEKFYAGARLEGADSLLASVQDEIDEDGVIDTLPTRLTSGDEQSSSPIVELPSAYREAAAEAIEGEQIPPGYRDAVKRYFDDLE